VTKPTLPMVAALAAVCVSWAPAAAQDAHYWNYGYGPIGQLTEGALVGGVGDLSAVFYNPAACALLDEPRIVLTLNSVELASIDVPGAAGEGLDVDQLIFDIVPAMVAGHVGRHDDGGSHFAFAFLARHDSDFDLGYGAARVSGSTPDAAAGYGRFRQRLVEYWLGGSWSHRVSPRASVGVSPFVAYRAQRSRRSLSLEEAAGGETRAFFVGAENEYTHVRVLAKLGLAWRPGRWELGATVTTPGLGVWGTGKSVFNATASGAVASPVLSASTQRGLEAEYRSPWSAAAGATRRWADTAVHATVEWFSSVDPYDVLAPEPAPVAGRPETIPLTYEGAARSVVNVGVGVERRLSDTVVLYGAAARNSSAHVDGTDSFASWDLDDVTAGVTLDRGSRTLALGVGYARGSDSLPQLVAPPGESAPPPRQATFSRWTISVGVSFDGR
jgi:hypothetical protein